MKKSLIRMLILWVFVLALVVDNPQLKLFYNKRMTLVQSKTKVIYCNVLTSERNKFYLPFLPNSEKSVITSNVTHILILD